VGIRKIVAGGAIAIAVGGIAAAMPVDPVALQGDVVTDTPSGSVSLVAFNSCEGALSGLRRAAWPHISAYGFGGQMVALDARGGSAIPNAVPDGPVAAAGESGRTPGNLATRPRILTKPVSTSPTLSRLMANASCRWSTVS
jgi:hypothetical protein